MVGVDGREIGCLFGIGGGIRGEAMDDGELEPEEVLVSIFSNGGAMRRLAGGVVEDGGLGLLKNDGGVCVSGGLGLLKSNVDCVVAGGCGCTCCGCNIGAGRPKRLFPLV